MVSTNGDTHLGGDDFDGVIIDHFAETFLADNNMDLRKDPMSLQRLKDAAAKVKHMKRKEQRNYLKNKLPILI